MKKCIALLLALLMAAFAIPACAETLEIVPGTPAQCPIDEFKNWFNLSITSSGYDYNFEWDSDPVSEDGFDVYTAKMENGPEMKVYTVGGNVSHVIGTHTGTFSATDTSSATKFGECLGAVLGGGCSGLAICELGVDELKKVAANFQSEITPLLTTLVGGFTSADKLAEGVAGTATGMGYPVGLDLVGSVSGTDITLTMRIIITSKDGQLNIK